MKSWIKILIGLVLGIIAGLILGPHAKYLAIFGKVFINLMSMLVILIIFSSLVVGMCHIHDPKRLGRIGYKTIGFYVVTTIIAIVIGITFALLIKPGDGLASGTLDVNFVSSPFDFKLFFLSLIPSNPFAAFAEGNVLQVIVFAFFFAISLIFTKEKSKPILTLLESVSSTMHQLTHFVSHRTHLSTLT